MTNHSIKPLIKRRKIKPAPASTTAFFTFLCLIFCLPLAVSAQCESSNGVEIAQVNFFRLNQIEVRFTRPLTAEEQMIIRVAASWRVFEDTGDAAETPSAMPSVIEVKNEDVFSASLILNRDLQPKSTNRASLSWGS